MTDPELQGLAAQALNMARRDIEQKGALQGLLAMYYEGQGLHRLTMVEELLAKQLGVDWMDHDRKKAIGFDVMRHATEQMHPDAVAVAVAINRFEPTAKLKAMDPD